MRPIIKNIPFVLDEINKRLCASAKRVHGASIDFNAIPWGSVNIAVVCAGNKVFS